MLRSALVILFFSGPAAAASFSVQQDGSGDYETLQEALAYAAEGDTIEVGPGTDFPTMSFGTVGTLVDNGLTVAGTSLQYGRTELYVHVPSFFCLLPPQ